MPRRLEQTPRPARIGRPGAALLLAALGLGLLTACTVPAPGPSPSAPTSGPPAAAPSAPADSTPGSPALQAQGTASDNLTYFAAIVSGVWAGPDRTSGRAYIDALEAGGFDRSAMQVTNDQSTVGNPAESIQFSVLWAGECLVGQVGPATGDPVSAVLPALPGGGCLIGKTRPIDW